MNYRELFLGLFICLIAHCVSWFGYSAQFVWDFWKTRPLLSIMVFSIPASFLFWVASKHTFLGTHSIWELKWLFFAISFIPMFVFGSAFMHESFATTKNFITIFFVFCIMATQFFYRV